MPAEAVSPRAGTQNPIHHWVPDISLTHGTSPRAGAKFRHDSEHVRAEAALGRRARDEAGAAVSLAVVGKLLEPGLNGGELDLEVGNLASLAGGFVAGLCSFGLLRLLAGLGGARGGLRRPEG